VGRDIGRQSWYEPDSAAHVHGYLCADAHVAFSLDINAPANGSRHAHSPAYEHHHADTNPHAPATAHADTHTRGDEHPSV